MLMEAGPPSPEETTVVIEELSAVSRRNNVTVSGNPGGRAIVFAHGFGCNQSAWRFVTPAFLADYKVIVFDHVGAGSSDASAYSLWKYDSLLGYADDLLEILDELDVTDVVYVGRPVYGQPQSTITLFKLVPGTDEAIRVPVKLGRASVNHIEIVEGLSVGDTVLLSDMSQHDSQNRIKLKK